MGKKKREKKKAGENFDPWIYAVNQKIWFLTPELKVWWPGIVRGVNDNSLFVGYHNEEYVETVRQRNKIKPYHSDDEAMKNSSLVILKRRRNLLPGTIELFLEACTIAESSVTTPLGLESSADLPESTITTPLGLESSPDLPESTIPTPLGLESSPDLPESTIPTPLGLESRPDLPESTIPTPLGLESSPDLPETTIPTPLGLESSPDLPESTIPTLLGLETTSELPPLCNVHSPSIVTAPSSPLIGDTLGLRTTRFLSENQVNDSCSNSDEDADLVTSCAKDGEESDFSDTLDVQTSKCCKITDKSTSSTGIFMPRITQCKWTKTGKEKSSDRVWNKKHYCFLCDFVGSNISRHLRTHAEDSEVAAILASEKGGKNVKTQMHLLTQKGDHQHNLKVVEDGSGELVLARRTTKDSFKSAEYGPCPKCFLWLKEIDLGRHTRKFCIAKTSYFSEGTCQQNQKIVFNSRLLKTNCEVPEEIVKEVISKMQSGDVRQTVENDKLIQLLGHEWLLRASRNKLRRANYSSERMRRAARILHLARKLDSTAWSMDEFISPQKLDILVQATVQECCSDDTDKQALNISKPSSACKFGHDLKKMAETKETIAIKTDNVEKEREAKRFLKVLQKDWPLRVSLVSHDIRREREWKKKIVLPLPEDLSKFSAYIKKEIRSLLFEIERAMCPVQEIYRKAVELVQARLAVYNKRRPAEIDIMKVEAYLEASSTHEQIPPDILKQLSLVEQDLFERHKMVVVRGKKHQPAPILVPEDCYSLLQYLCDETNRSTMGVTTLRDKEETYIFANTGSSVFRSCDSLRSIREKAGTECDLTNPNVIRCTELRKYIATTVQLLDLTPQEMKWVTRHLSHSQNVHDTYYRNLSSVIEKAKISKLLILADSGKMGQYTKQSLDSIRYEDVVLQWEKEPFPCEDSENTDTADSQLTLDKISDDTESDEESTPEQAGPSGVACTPGQAGPSGVQAGPSGVQAGPSGVQAGPSGVQAGPSGVQAGPSGVQAGPSGVQAGPSGVQAGPSGLQSLPGQGGSSEGPTFQEPEDLPNSVPSKQHRPKDPPANVLLELRRKKKTMKRHYASDHSDDPDDSDYIDPSQNSRNRKRACFSDESDKKRARICRRGQKATWTHEENDEIEAFFEQVIDERRPKMPNKAKLTEFMAESRYQAKGYTVIKNKVNSIYQRVKRRKLHK